MKAHLLIVDDEKEICDMLSRHFRFLEYAVQTASNGKEALAVLEKQKIDVVISDIVMPEMDGVELLRHIRQHYPMVRTIMITGYVTLENALTCMRKQADTLIFKPLEDMRELEEAVADAVHVLRRWEKKLKELQSINPEKDMRNE